MCASVIAGGDAAPVLELGEQVLDLVALTVEGLVVVEGNFATAAGRDARLDATCFQFLAEPRAVVTAIGDEVSGGWQGVEHEAGALVVAHLAFRQQQDDRPAVTAADGVELGVQPAFGSPDTTGNIPFLSRLAAVRWAFRCVASIMMCSGFGPSPASPAKMRSNTPIRLQRMKRL